MMNPDEPVVTENTLNRDEYEMDDTPVPPVPRRSDPGTSDKHKKPDVVGPRSWKRDPCRECGREFYTMPPKTVWVTHGTDRYGRPIEHPYSLCRTGTSRVRDGKPQQLYDLRDARVDRNGNVVLFDASEVLCRHPGDDELSHALNDLAGRAAERWIGVGAEAADSKKEDGGETELCRSRRGAEGRGSALLSARLPPRTSGKQSWIICKGVSSLYRIVL